MRRFVRTSEEKEMTAKEINDLLFDLGACHVATGREPSIYSRAKDAILFMMADLKAERSNYRELEREHRDDIRSAGAEARWQERERHEGY